jgi:tetratricopeptide (TPR) repeat protein
MRSLAFSSLLLLLGAAGCKTTAAPRTVLHNDLGFHSRKVTTSSPEAQRWFDQGLTLIFSFNHEQAGRSFAQAARLDPQCAMAHWGQALAAGPHINNPTMDAAASQAASAAVARARELAPAAQPVEQDLIAALSQRYTEPPPEDRAQLDAAYASVMREVHRKYPEDADVAVLFAESMMDLRPWDLWTADGKPQPGTEEIVATLESVLARHPRHPGACHYYIHAVEASPQPEKAVPAADRLASLVPGAGHMVHMPGHIYQRLGRYADAIAANQKAIAVDRAHLDTTGRGGFHAVYRAHNFHFLSWSAMYEGRSKLSEEAARDLVRELPLEIVESLPDFLDFFLAMPLHVHIRFGHWEEILREPKPKATLPVTTAFWHYARGLAYSATGRLEECTAEMRAFDAASQAISKTAMVGNNDAKPVLEIARTMLEGEMLFRRGQHDAAFEKLREAVRREEALKYGEPWDWVQPSRHALGALLLQAGRVAEAETVYREDLKLHPENGWSLHGLAECLRRQGRVPDAAAAEARFQTAWARADVTLKGSCFCRTAD